MSHELANRNGSLGFWDPFFAPFFEEDEDASYGVLDMKTDIKEVGDNYQMEVELPGFDKKNIQVALNDGYLTVTAHIDRNSSNKDDKGSKENYLHRERFSGTTSRTYYVGDVKKEDIKAAYKDGVLTLTFPKEQKKEALEENTIAIE